MAKGSGIPRRKTLKVSEVLPTSSQRAKAWFFRPRQLAITAVSALLLLLFPIAVRQLPGLNRRPEYQITAERITISPPPRWTPPDLTQQVFERAGLAERESLHDPTLSERIAAAFHTHPWVDRVVSVRKSFPARVHVELVYREPVAMVRGIDGHYPVDCNGVLLPARDFSDSDVERFPMIERVASVPTGNLGEPWGDPAVAGAAELAAILSKPDADGGNWWSRLELSAILVPRRVALAEAVDQLEFRIRTSGGSEILWGRGPSSQHPGELTVEQKLQRLADFRRDYGGFDDQHGPYQIDIRPWHGINRGLLARQTGESSVR